MKEYEVIIDLGSKTFRVHAETPDKAKTIAFNYFEALSPEDKIEDYWVGDILEVKE
jgi:hypothetical protein